jgi:hypothetical protein
MSLARLHASWQLGRTHHALVEHGWLPPPTTGACRVGPADITSKHLREIISSVPLPHPPQCQAPERPPSQKGRRPLQSACRLVMIILLRPPASRWIKKAASIRFQLSGITCRVDFRPSAPTLSCNRREPGFNSASAQICPTSPERARALRAHGVALLRATWHLINGQTARMFLRPHC